MRGSFLAAQSLSFEEWYGLFSNISEERERLIFHILYATGCSEKELLELKISDIHSLHLFFSNRKCSISEVLAQELHSFSSGKSTSSFLFSSRQSSALSAKRLQQIVSSVSQQALGIRITPQDIRVTHIYHALLKNVSLVSIAEHVGLSYQRLGQIIESLESKLQKYRYEL